MIINFTPTGMIPTKEMTDNVPISVDEIVDNISSCIDIGINMVHVHARDGEGKPSYKKEIYAKIIEGIRKEYPDLVICVSLSGRDFSEFEKRSDPLSLTGDLKPDMGSLTLSSLNFPRSASINSPDMVMRLAEAMLDKDIKPELEVFDLGMMNYAHYLIKKGLLKPPYYFNIILGNIASAQARMSHLATMVSDLPENSVWCVGGIGNTQLVSNILGISFGNGVRVGLEDNIHYDQDRKILATNEQLVERVIRVAEIIGKRPNTQQEVRSLLEL